MTLQTICYKNHIIKIVDDEMPYSPRESDNLGKMVCFHRRYSLGDKHEFSNSQELQKFLKKEKPYCLPIYGYDHGGISISTEHVYPFNCPWDSGQLGIIYITKEKMKKETGYKRDFKKHAEKIMRAEVKTYNNYLTGNVVGFQVEDGQGEILESCYGFYGNDGRDEAESQGKSAVDYELKRTGEQMELAI